MVSGHQPAEAALPLQRTTGRRPNTMTEHIDPTFSKCAICIRDAREAPSRLATLDGRDVPYARVSADRAVQARRRASSSGRRTRSVEYHRASLLSGAAYHLFELRRTERSEARSVPRKGHAAVGSDRRMDRRTTDRRSGHVRSDMIFRADLDPPRTLRFGRSERGGCNRPIPRWGSSLTTGEATSRSNPRIVDELVEPRQIPGSRRTGNGIEAR